ncbi:MAG: flavin monoamine oxidase family protein [Moraxellaceae bacterium]|nr:flavin monoamine oxidase family protein [Moraxellaceae bacterium]
MEAAGALKPQRLPARKVDVAIVGGGISGLTTARRLSQAGLSVVVLEADDRVGGRTLSLEYAPGKIAELGGTWIGNTQDRILALAKELGLTVFPQFNEGKTVYCYKGKRSTYSDTGFTGAVPPDPMLLPDLAIVTTLINRMAAKLPPGEPWNAPDAEEWDRQTLDTWLRRHTLTTRTLKFASAAFETVFGTEGRDISLLSALHHVNGAGNAQHPGTFDRLIETRNGAQEFRIAEGTQQFSIRMAAALGERVVLSSPVRKIRQTDDGVYLESDRLDVEARQVVVAVPPSMAGRITYAPPLPAARDQLSQRYALGWLIKCEAVYDTPFWRAQGLSGGAVGDVGPAKLAYDVSPPEGNPGVLLGFVGGDEARRWGSLPPASLRAAVIENFVTYFGPKAREVKEFYIHDWASEIWNRGGPIAFGGPGTLTGYGPALRDPVGRIHWGGTETADFWHGFMDGAVRAGEQAAADVLVRIQVESVRR